MNLRQAAEMALEALEDIFGKEKKDVGAINALRQALTAEEALDRMVAENQRLGLYDDGPAVKPNYCTPEETPEVTPEVPCKTHPDAPHGFDRNASHSADRYVCECEGWEPPKREWVGLTDDEIWD